MCRIRRKLRRYKVTTFFLPLYDPVRDDERTDLRLSIDKDRVGCSLHYVESNCGTFLAACSLIFRLYISLLLMNLYTKNKKKRVRQGLNGEMIERYWGNNTGNSEYYLVRRGWLFLTFHKHLVALDSWDSDWSTGPVCREAFAWWWWRDANPLLRSKCSNKWSPRARKMMMLMMIRRWRMSMFWVDLSGRLRLGWNKESIVQGKKRNEP